MALSKSFNHKEFEDRIYQMWLDRGYFAPPEPSRVDPEDERFVIVIPPPNVTGVLHMGHGLNNSLQDVLTRYYRMRGAATLWVPGTDHAGIATQNVVDKKLRSQGIDRYELGREKFVQETWKVKEEHHGIITRQLRKIGASVDWSRERFTLDEGLSRAVREVFVRLYERNLIYRGNYLVNWCPSCGTALSDDEVEYHQVNGAMYHYRYPLADGSGYVDVATTRPETMLGDTGVAVHPEDERYRDIVGKEVLLPLTQRRVPIIADEYVDREFGTGVVKVTPAHDPNDWEMGQRHDLDTINILNPDGTANENVPERYRGLPMKEARKLVVEDLKEQGYFLYQEDHSHQVGHCYRCDTVIEPYLSDQWFVRMRPPAEKALAAWERGEVRFFPKRWENTYTSWLRGIRDWCISRQLWWGHRIPVWYDEETGEEIVSREDPTTKPEYAGRKLRQDEDVLDTWFSSWLWPFSTLGWPENTADLKAFFPTTTLVTAYDIIFFWVSRMIMASLEFMGEVPFRDIYITGLIRDKQGRKMSKSKGNGIDPLDVVDEFGADAHKFTLAFMATSGQDILLEKDDFNFGSKFANKIWNAARYIFLNIDADADGTPPRILPRAKVEQTDIDRWVYHRLNAAAQIVRESMQQYRFSDATRAVYEYFWNDFCDWYIEASKLSLYSTDPEEKTRGLSALLYVLEESLRLLHPFMSFITEELYQKLPEFPEEERRDAVIVAPYPEFLQEREDGAAARRFQALQELVRKVRTLRSEFTIPPSKRIRFHIHAEEGFEAGSYLAARIDLIESLAGGEGVTIEGVSAEAAQSERPGADTSAIVEAGSLDTAGSIALVGVGFEAYVFVRDVIDVDAEVVRLKKNRDKADKQLSLAAKKLANEGFLKNASTEVVDREREKHDELSRQVERMNAYLVELQR